MLNLGVNQVVIVALFLVGIRGMLQIMGPYKPIYPNGHLFCIVTGAIANYLFFIVLL